MHIHVSENHAASFLGAFAKLGKATIIFVMHVRPFVHMQQVGSQWRDFDETLIFEFFF
jgi:hypothetical protein